MTYQRALPNPLSAPTPWRVARADEIVNLRMFTTELDPPDVGGIVDANGVEVLGSSEFLHGHEFLPRICEAVNACASMLEPVAEIAFLRGAAGRRLPPLSTGERVPADEAFPNTYDELLKQRDDLADALRSIVMRMDGRTGFTMFELADNARAALAKVRS